MSIHFKTDFANARLRQIPPIENALREAGAIFSAEYANRIASGRGVDAGRETQLASNPPWVQRLKGHSNPLIGDGGMSHAVITETGRDKATIKFSDAQTPGGINGQRSSRYSDVALRMQVGGEYSNVYIDYGRGETVTRETLEVQARPHFFTTANDREQMARPIFARFEGLLAEGIIER